MTVRYFSLTWALCIPQGAFAATFTVQSVLDETDLVADCICATASGSCSLRAAIQEANSCTVDPVNRVVLDPGIYDLSLPGPGADDAGDLDIFYNVDVAAALPGTVWITGVGLAAAHDPDRIFHVHPGAELTVSSVFLESGSTSDGGGLLWNEGTARVVGAGLRDGAAGVGGCVLNEGDLELADLEVHLCQANSGGALANTGTLLGTGIQVYESRATSGSGGALWNSGGQVVLQKAEISGCSATLYGGGIHNFGARATLDLTDGIVQDNVGISGGGIATAYGGLTHLSRTRLEGNLADVQGGALHTYQGTLHVTESTCANNESISYGGGCFMVVSSSQMSVSNSAIHSNRGRFGGGGFVWGSDLDMVDSTVYGNEAVVFDGGGLRGTLGTIRLAHVTLASNRAAGSGGGISITGGTTDIASSILDDNQATGSGPQCSGTVSSAGYNRIDSVVGCGWISGPSDSFGSSLLGALTLGGRAGFDHVAPLPGSLAIDTADPAVCAPTDQIGTARVGVCDRGAIEAP